MAWRCALYRYNHYSWLLESVARVPLFVLETQTDAEFDNSEYSN